LIRGKIEKCDQDRGFHLLPVAAVFKFGGILVLQGNHSIKHALSLLGEREIRRWVRLWLHSARRRTNLLSWLLCSGARALSANCYRPRSSMGIPIFPAGVLLSLIDTILEYRWRQFWRTSPSIKRRSLCCWEAPAGLRPLYQLMLAQESGEFEQSSHLANQLQLKDDEVAELYWQALSGLAKSPAGNKRQLF